MFRLLLSILLTTFISPSSVAAAQAAESPLERGKRLSGITSEKTARMASATTGSTAKATTSSTPCWASKTASSGQTVSELSKLDANVRAFMKQYQLPAGNLVVRYKGVVVLERGYGWKDSACKKKMPFDGMFRVASLSKAVTSAMLRNLLAKGRVRSDDRVFCTGGNTNCILSLANLKVVDARVRDITVQHLIDHQGGWDRAVSGDPVFSIRAIADAQHVASPPSKTDIVRYVLGRPLDFAPGSQFAYSNFGYLVLGLVIEKITGKSYYAHEQADLLTPLAIRASDLKGAGTLEMDLDTREPFYSAANTGLMPSLYDQRGPRSVPLVYGGGWDMESLGGSAALLASTRAYTRFLNAYWISGDNKRRVPCDNCGFVFFGSLTGTATMALQRGPDIDVALFFNQREEMMPAPFFDAMYQAVDAGLNKVTRWPTTPPRGHQP